MGDVTTGYRQSGFVVAETGLWTGEDRVSDNGEG